MSTGYTSFDHTVQEANHWLKAVAEELHFEDRRYAYPALRAVLHALRDRLTPESAVHLSAQLPMVVRGLFFEGWKMWGTPTNEHSVDAFCARIAGEFPPMFPIDAQTVTKGVFAVIWREIDPGETAKLIDQLPGPLKTLWPSMAKRG